MNIEDQYLSLLKEVLAFGHNTSDRTGTGTLSSFGHQIRHDFGHGFPLLTTKKVFWKGVVEELLWMLRGETNVKSLQEKGVHIWDAWAKDDGELGPVYGCKWRNWGGFDQIQNLIHRIKYHPDCRRLIVSAWDPVDIDKMQLPPCHCFFQFKVYGEYLYCKLYQRSADLFLGVPFNIASYSLLTYIIAYMTGLKPGGFIHTFGDAHIYKNHIDQVKEQLSREPLRLPHLTIRTDKEITDPAQFVFENFQLGNYTSHPPIKAPVSV